MSNREVEIAFPHGYNSCLTRPLKEHWPNSLFRLVAANPSAVVLVYEICPVWGITLPFSQQDHNLQSLPVHGSSLVVLQELILDVGDKFAES